MKRSLLFALFFAALIIIPAAATAEAGKDSGIELHASARSPDQIAAFYEARGFPRAAITALTQTCFVTVSFHNRSDDVVWLEPSRWRFVDEHGREVKRRNRAYWNALWGKLGVPMANRATFGWTQLPEVRDLRPSEPVGGNVALLPPPGRFRLEARFATGANKQGKEIMVILDNLFCPGREIK